VAVRVDRSADPAAFWRDTKAFLERDEARNTQVLAIASRHAVEAGDTAPSGFTVTEAGKLIAAAMLTAKGTLFLTPAGPDALQALNQAIAEGGQVVTDIVAEKATAEACAQLAGAPFRTHVGLRLYRLEAVNPVPAVPGAMRKAFDADFDLLCAWQRAFFEEANVRESVDEIPHLVNRRVQTGGAWFWEVDGVAVVHAGHRLTPIRSVRIAPVYTPPEHRGRGYATALVAELSRHLLAQGRFPLYLFADTENPVANGVYCRVGFRPAGEHVHLTRVDAAS
jgi:predicted GNAT family acetyltransferase